MLDVRSVQQNSIKWVDTLLVFAIRLQGSGLDLSRSSIMVTCMQGFLGGTGLSSLVSGDTTAAMGLHSLAWHPHQERTSCRLKKERNLSNTNGCIGLCRWHSGCWWRGMRNVCWQVRPVRACETVTWGMARDGGGRKGKKSRGDCIYTVHFAPVPNHVVTSSLI